MTTTAIRPGHSASDTQRTAAGSDPDNPQAIESSTPRNRTSAGPTLRPGQTRSGAHPTSAGSDTDHPQARRKPTPRGDSPAGPIVRPGHLAADAQSLCDGSDTDHPQVIPPSTPNADPPAGPTLQPGQARIDTHATSAGSDLDHPQAHASSASNLAAPAGPLLLDPYMALAADIVDDLENTRKANANRLGALTRSTADKDGETRGWGLSPTDPDVMLMADIVAGLGKVEHQAVLQLQRYMRAHPLGPWQQAHRGIGEKQLARLLASIGDPYWNTLHNRPRTVSELWAFCGYHTVPVIHRPTDAQRRHDGGDSVSAGGDQRCVDTQLLAVAARRRKGERANWSNTAKMRAYLIAERCMVAGDNEYRDAYDTRKAATEGRTHAVACVRCGPTGKPAQPGSEWSAGHRHADALRVAAKAILRDLWRESKRLHGAGEP